MLNIVFLGKKNSLPILDVNENKLCTYFKHFYDAEMRGLLRSEITRRCIVVILLGGLADSDRAKGLLKLVFASLAEM